MTRCAKVRSVTNSCTRSPGSGQPGTRAKGAKGRLGRPSRAQLRLRWSPRTTLWPRRAARPGAARAPSSDRTQAGRAGRKITDVTERVVDERVAHSAVRGVAELLDYGAARAGSTGSHGVSGVSGVSGGSAGAQSSDCESASDDTTTTGPMNSAGAAGEGGAAGAPG